MDGGAAGLRFVLDQNLGRHVLEFIRQSGVCAAEEVTSLEEMGYPRNLADEEWMADLGARSGGHVAVTRDGNILSASIRRNAWLSSGLGLILLDKRWGSLRRGEWPRHILYWWPYMAQAVLEGPPGAAWTVSCRIPAPPKEWIRQVSGPGVPPLA